MTRPGCGCCECRKTATPAAVANRAGLSALTYRVGTYATFLESMTAELSSAEVPALGGLTTSDPGDPARAMLDAWATTADVLTFYQERVANEGYLRTAQERRSILELGRLVGYELRPGVAASAYLAYTTEPNATADIPAGSRVQSVPLPGEKPQTFETYEPLHASFLWNDLRPRLTRPQAIALADASVFDVRRVWFAGTKTNLKPQNALLFVFGRDDFQQVVRLVKEVIEDTANDRTEVVLQPFPRRAKAIFIAVGELIERINADPATRVFTVEIAMLEQIRRQGGVLGVYESEIELGRALQMADDLLHRRHEFQQFIDFFDGRVKELLTPPDSGGPRNPPTLQTLVESLLLPPSLQPRSPRLLGRSLVELMAPGTESRSLILQSIRPQLRGTFDEAFAHANFTPRVPPLQAVFAMRETATLFGASAALKQHVDPGPAKAASRTSSAQVTFEEWDLAATDLSDSSAFFLDREIEGVTAGGWAVVRSEEAGPTIAPIDSVRVVARNDYGLTAKAMRVALARPWWTLPATGSAKVARLKKPSKAAGVVNPRQLTFLRTTTVLVRSEELQLTAAPIDGDVGAGTDDRVRIELDTYCPGLQSGRWIIVSGTRIDVAGSELDARELVMLAGVEQSPADRGETPRTVFILANDGLAYRYRRASVHIQANVVRATHGETKEEILGSGNASATMQRFTLRNAPLTWISAPTPSGVATTLAVRVNDVLWDETDSLAGSEPSSHLYTTTTSDDAKTSVQFGNGREGSRVPTGTDNVKARYRAGLGLAGNLRAGQLTLLNTRPLGVKEVVNPLPAGGGAEAESRDDARRNVPVALQALDRLVSVRDYESFARTFAGVAKASARRLAGKRVAFVHLTIAGAGDAPVDRNSDLRHNLIDALERYGDPSLGISVDVRSRVTVILSARVRIDPHYLWDRVEPMIRARLTERFGFAARSLGQTLYPSEVIAAIQSIAGVDWVDLDDLRGIPEESGLPTIQLGAPDVAPVKARLARLDDDGIHAAELAYVTPEITDTVVLKVVTP